MLNKVEIQARMVADPELKETKNGTKVASFRIACDRNFKDKESGERGCDFLTVVAWRNSAEFLCRYFKKGDMIIVEGRLQSRSYDDKDGNKRYVIEIVADNLYFGGSKKDSASTSDVPLPSESEAGVGSTTGAGDAQFSELTDEEELPF